MNHESVPTTSCSSVSLFLRFVVTEPSRMKSVRTEGCHVGLFREFGVTACCTYGQPNTTIDCLSSFVRLRTKEGNSFVWFVVFSPFRSSTSSCPGRLICKYVFLCLWELSYWHVTVSQGKKQIHRNAVNQMAMLLFRCVGFIIFDGG